jgi:hypothetical protein
LRYGNPCFFIFSLNGPDIPHGARGLEAGLRGRAGFETAG